MVHKLVWNRDTHRWDCLCGTKSSRGTSIDKDVTCKLCRGWLGLS